MPERMGTGVVGSVPPASASAAGTLAAADYELMKLGAKSAIDVTMNAFGTWADGQTIVLPGIGSHTLKVTTTGDIDIVGLGEAAAKAAIVAYLNAHAGATVSVAIVGTSTTMTVTALAYGTTLNGTVISGTMLAASGTMASGLPPQLSNPMPSNQQPANVTVHDAAFNAASVAVAGLSSEKRYRISGSVLSRGEASLVGSLLFDAAGDSWCILSGVAIEQLRVIQFNGLEVGICTFELTLLPRRNGRSASVGTTCAKNVEMPSTTVKGGTEADYTGFDLQFSGGVPETGWLTVIEETS